MPSHGDAQPEKQFYFICGFHVSHLSDSKIQRPRLRAPLHFHRMQLEMDACGNKPRTKLDNLAARRFRNLTARYYQIDEVLILFERFSWNQAHLIRSCFRACLPVFVCLSCGCAFLRGVRLSVCLSVRPSARPAGGPFVRPWRWVSCACRPLVFLACLQMYYTCMYVCI